MPKKRQNVGAKPDINKIGRFDTETRNVDWNIFFANPGFSEVTNQILELLDDKTIEIIREFYNSVIFFEIRISIRYPCCTSARSVFCLFLYGK